MKEAWLFGKLETIGEDEGEAATSKEIEGAVNEVRGLVERLLGAREGEKEEGSGV